MKIIVGFVALLSFYYSLATSYDVTPAILWYQSFFQENQNQSIDEALKQGISKLQKASRNQDKGEEAKALKELSLIHLTRTHAYEQAMGFCIRALAIEDSLDLESEQIFTYLIIAEIFEQVGDLFKSAEFLEKALQLNEEQKDPHILTLILNELGKTNAAMGRIEEAFENYALVLNYKEEVGPEVEAAALFNLAHLYTIQGKYSEALQHHKRSLSLKRTLNDKKGEAQSLNDIGKLYSLMKNNDKAMANHLVALEIRQRTDDKEEIAESYNNIGILYYQMREFSKAIANLELALYAGQKSQAQDQMRYSFEYLSLCYKALGDHEKALYYKDLLLEITDFIQNEKNAQGLLETQTRYELDKRESEIAKLEMDRMRRGKELAAQKKIRNFLFVLIGLSVVIVILVYYLYRLNKRSNKVLQAVNVKVQHQNTELQDLNATKDKFFSIISHDLKGPLNSLTSFSGLLINHTENLSKDEIKMLAGDLDRSLKNLFALLENLLEWSRSQTGNIEFKPEVFNMVEVLNGNKELLEGQAKNKDITILHSSDNDLLVNAHKNSVNTIVRNLLSNAIKFTPQKGTIMLSAKQVDDEVMVSVADTGVGMKPEIINKLFRIDTKHSTKGTADEKGTGLGLILCKEFVEKNGGRIWVESEEGKGSIFHFTLPSYNADKNSNPDITRNA